MSAENLREIFQKYRAKGLLVDSNLLLLYLSGRANVELISASKPLRSHSFTLDDYAALYRVVGFFGKRLFTTPHILTEVSNLSTKLPGATRIAFFQSTLPRIAEWQERYVPSQLLSQHDCFPRFGLTDTAIINLAPGSLLVLTIDFELSGYLQKRNVDAINFKELRKLWRNSPGVPHSR
jgi:hypothetical protein